MRFDYFCRYLRLYSHKCYYLFSIFQIGFFFFPLKISLNLPESLQRGAPQCPTEMCRLPSRKQHQSAVGFCIPSGPLDISRGLQGRGRDPYKDVNNVQKRNLVGFNVKKWVAWLNSAQILLLSCPFLEDEVVGTQKEQFCNSHLCKASAEHMWFSGIQSAWSWFCSICMPWVGINWKRSCSQDRNISPPKTAC